jgi:hypothetical protein
LDFATQHDHHAVTGRPGLEYGFAGRKITNLDASEKCFFFPTLEVAKQLAFAEQLEGHKMKSRRLTISKSPPR